MTKCLMRACALAAVVALAGCGRARIDTNAPEDRGTRLGEQSDQVGDLAELLKRPREELAKLADEQDDIIDKQREGFRNHAETDLLLPKLNAPRSAPVFRKAKYDAKRGFSLPDYVKGEDPAVAAHLTRHGDFEAAGKLGGKAAQGEKNYPVEWTRLVGLKLISAQNKLAVGDPDGATEVAVIHRQLGEILDAKAAAGPLGAALLPGGRRALRQAAKAFRLAPWKKTALAEDIDAALKAWGKVPVPPSALGAGKAEAAALFGTPAQGRVIVAGDLDRARDLLALPLPTEAAQSIVAFLDEHGAVGEVAVAYRGKLETDYPEADHLAYHLDEAGISGRQEPKTPGVSKTAYEAIDHFEITRTHRSPGIGALVRVNGKTPAESGGLRVLGPIDFDRGFDANRTAWAPAVAGPAAKVEDAGALKRLVSGTAVPAPGLAVLRREADADVVKGLQLTWLPDVNADAAARLLPALAWLGPASIEGAEDKEGASLRLRWRDAKTRAELRLPYDAKPAVLSIEDAQPASAKAERGKLAHHADVMERQERINSGKPSLRLARSPGAVNDFALDKLELGQSREAAEAALPKGRGYRLTQVPGGLSLMILTTPEEGAPYWANQVLIRIEQDKVSEIRVRYTELAARKGEALSDRLSDQKAGRPEEVPAPWATLRGDLPGRSHKVAAYRWQDDRTVRTYQTDAGGAEVTWRDRDTTATPWRFVGQGPAKEIVLGETRQAIEKAYKPDSTSNGATNYRAAAKGQYELYMVWYRNDRAERIVAVHRARPGVQPEEVTAALKKAWGHSLDQLGAVRRQEGKRGDVLGAFTFHDDVTRIHTFAQLEDQGAKLLTEWRPWPASPTAVASR